VPGGVALNGTTAHSGRLGHINETSRGTPRVLRRADRRSSPRSEKTTDGGRRDLRRLGFAMLAPAATRLVYAPWVGRAIHHRASGKRCRPIGFNAATLASFPMAPPRAWSLEGFLRPGTATHPMNRDVNGGTSDR
jgi:hypothetical protein